MSKTYEAARQKAAKEYKGRLEDARQEIRDLRDKNDRLLCENLELEAKVEQQAEWIERLLEFTELSPEEAKQLRRRVKVEAELSDTFGGWASVFAKAFTFHGLD